MSWLLPGLSCLHPMIQKHQERRGSLSYNWEDVASPNDVDGEGAVGMEVKEFFNEYFMPVTTEF